MNNSAVAADLLLVFLRGLRYQPHMAKETIENLAKTLAETLPEGLRSLREDIEKNFRSVLQSGLGKLDLVTREEFEVQQAVLARSREKLAALEERLAALEAGKPASRKAAKKKSTKKKASKKKPG